MEVAILAALALVGHELNSKRPLPPASYVAPERSQEYPFTNQNFTEVVQEDERERVRAALGRDPVPYFSSAATQHTNDSVKDTRLELYTGRLEMDNSATGVYRHKLEQAPLFDPKNSETLVGQTGGYTTLAETEEERYRHYQPSHLRNNVKPVAPQQVGPGIGVGPNVSAVGHFHPERDARHPHQRESTPHQPTRSVQRTGGVRCYSGHSKPRCRNQNPPRWHWGRETEPTGVS